MQILVRDNTIDQASKASKRKLQREGLLPAPQRKPPMPPRPVAPSAT